MIKWIVTGVLTAFSIIFACLKSVWAGFIYLGLACFASLCAVWIILRIKKYIKDYYINFEKAFISYKADYINRNNIFVEEFENNEKLHRNKFKKLLRREKFIDIFIILFLIILLIMCVVAVARL